MTQNILPSKKVGENLKNLIKESKFKTQINFADAMFVDDSTVRKWIRRGVHSIDLIMDIAEKLEIDFLELLK